MFAARVDGGVCEAAERIARTLAPPSDSVELVDRGLNQCGAELFGEAACCFHDDDDG